MTIKDMAIRVFKTDKGIFKGGLLTMNYTIRHKQMQFNKEYAIKFDIYMYDGEKLVFMCNSMPEPKRKTWFAKIKHYFWCKKNGIVINLNRRTLEYIYNVCKGTMPSSKDEFVKCVMGTIKED